MIQLGNHNIQSISIGGGNISYLQLGDKPIFGNKEVITPSFNNNGHDYVDMGPAGVWSTCNVGASSPEGYGLYFQWGGIEGHLDASGDEPFNKDKYRFLLGDWRVEHILKYNPLMDKLTVLELEDDAANIYMGGGWRIPTVEEYEKLAEVCDAEYIRDYNSVGIRGVLFTLKSDKSKKIFFPYAGKYYNRWEQQINQSGTYWTSDLYKEDITRAWNMYVYNDSVSAGMHKSLDYRCLGAPIRAILDTTIN